MTGPEIKALRRKKKMSQKALGWLLGVDYHAIIKWEKGRRTPQPLHARMLDDWATGRLTEFAWVWDSRVAQATRPITDGP